MLDYGAGEELYWDPVHEEVRFDVANGERRLVCRISRAALERHGGPCAAAEDYVRLAREQFEHITHRISDKLSLDLTEPDGSVLIRARDW